MLTTADFKTTFQIDQDPKTFEFVDQSDVVSQGVDLADATGVFKITDPLNNVIYTNTDHGNPDINHDVSLINSTTILLPLDGSGNVIQGEYTIDYEVQDAGGAPDKVSVQKKFTLAYSSPTIDLVLTADCVQPLLSSQDITGYRVSGVDPDIIRDHKILYPPSTGQADLEGTGALLESATLFTVKGSTLQHTSTLTSTLTYDYGNDFFVTDSISGEDRNNVACDGELCDIYCCVRAEYNRYTSNLNVNKAESDLHLANFIQMTSLMEQIEVAQSCGKGQDISEYVTRINKLGNCEEGCDCDDGTPQLVTGLGGGAGTFVVNSGGAPIIVSSVVNGSVTTFTVSMDPAFVTKVNDSFNTDVIAGTDITVDLVVDGNGNKQYTVNATQAPIVSILSFLVEINLTDGQLPLVVVSDESIQGTAFENTAVVTNEKTPANTYIKTNTDFLIDEVWLSQGSLEFKPDIHIIDKIPLSRITPKNIFLEMFDKNSTDISFRFIDANGSVITGGVLNEWDRIKLQVTLTA